MKRFWFVLLIVTSLISLYVHFITVNGWLTDDAFISFRYAENLINGHGIVFNTGEYVEGYSNYLWVIFIAAGLWVGILPTSTVLFLNSLAAIGTVAVITFFVWKTEKSDQKYDSVSFPAMLLCGIGSFWIWTFGGGLETIFYTFIGTIIILWPILNGQTILKLIIIGILCSVQVLNRPEGLIYFAYVMSYYGILFYKKEVSFELLWFIIPFILIAAIYYVWKISYYGSIIPNTLYAKVDPSIGQTLRGFKYLFKYFALYPVVTFFFIIYISFFGISDKKTLPILGFLIVYFLFVILVGGDFMFGYRLLIPVIPLLIYYSYKGIRSLFSEKIIPLVIFLVITLSAVQTRFHPDIKWLIENDKTVSSGKVTGQWLAKTFPENTSIALNAAGAIPYYSKLKAIDMLGLTNREIAREGKTDIEPKNIGHLKSNAKIVIQLKPDLVMFGAGFGHKEPQMTTEKDLIAMPEFEQKYNLRVFSLDKDSLTLYVKRDFILPKALQ